MRESQWDFELNGMGYMVVRDKNDAPQWVEQSLAVVTGKEANTSEEESPWIDWTGGAFNGIRSLKNGYHYGKRVQAHVPNNVILGPEVTVTQISGRVVSFFEQDDRWYVAAGTHIYDVSDLTTIKYTTDQPITDTQPFDGRTVIACGDLTPYYTLDNDTLTHMTDAALKATKLCTFYAKDYYALARSYTSTEGKPAVDWMSEGAVHAASSWGAAYPIGDKTNPITELVAREQTVFAAKDDGLYYIDQTGRTPRVIEVAPDPTNGESLGIDTAGNVWYPAMDGHFRYNPTNGAIEDQTPWRDKSNRSPIYGRITARAQYRGWQYIAIFNGNDSYIGMGKETDNGFIWHASLYDISGAMITTLAISSLYGSPHMYFGTADGRVGSWRLQSSGDNPLMDSSYRYVSHPTDKVSSFYFGEDCFLTPNMYWQLMGFDVEFDEVDPTTSYAFIYVAMDDGDWIKVGEVRAPGQRYIRVPNGIWYTSRYEVRVDFYNTDATVTPRMRALDPRAIRRARMRPIIATTAYTDDRVLSRFNIQSRFSGLEQVNNLTYLESAPPTTLVDWWTGNRRERSVVVLPIKQTLIAQVEDESADAAATLSLVVIDANTNQYEIPYTQPWNWGEDDDDDSNEVNVLYYEDENDPTFVSGKYS